ALLLVRLPASGTGLDSRHATACLWLALALLTDREEVLFSAATADQRDAEWHRCPQVAGRAQHGSVTVRDSGIVLPVGGWRLCRDSRRAIPSCDDATTRSSEGEEE